MSNAREEHLATRRAAGIFDFSFMGLYEFADVAALQTLQGRDLARIAPGRIAYTLLLEDDGSVFNDATVWRLENGLWWLFSGRRSDADWIGARAKARVRSGEHAVLALQGPASGAILARLAGESLVRSLAYYEFTTFRTAAVSGHVGRIGYSGELGYEIVVAAREEPDMNRALREAGAAHGLRECTFAAADSLRIESGYVLFDREITGSERPEELGLERLVERNRLRTAAPGRRLVGLEVDTAAAAPRDRPWLPAARVTSESDSPLLGRRLALGYVAAGDARPGTVVALADGRRARIARLPFYDPMRRLPRAAPL